MNSPTLPSDGVYAYDKKYDQDVIRLILSIQQDEFGIPVGIADQPDLQAIPAFYQTNKGNFWIALRQGKVVGTIALLDIGKGRGALRKMFVAAAWRGKEYRVAQALLNTLLAWSIDHSYAEILLGTTEKFVAAHRFYEKNGFTEIPKNSLPPEFPVMSVDVKFYRLGATHG